MLSDEEKQAIEYLKSRLYGNEGCKFIDVAQSDLRIFLKLVEKQQKEIEELNILLKQQAKDIGYMILNYTSNDKIKAKIEPVLKQFEREMEEEYNKYGNSREYQDIVDAYNFLQSLLEKE